MVFDQYYYYYINILIWQQNQISNSDDDFLRKEICYQYILINIFVATNSQLLSLKVHMDPQKPQISEGDLPNQQMSISQENVQNKDFDRRTQIKNLQDLPYSSICQIISSSNLYKSNKWYGTGFLISKNLILMCAHNLYHRAKEEFPYAFQFDRVQLIFGQNQNYLSYLIQKKDFHFPELYKTSLDSTRYDYGIITIPEEIKSEALPLKFTGHSVDDGIKFGLVAGFPSFIYACQNFILDKNHQMYQDLDIFQIKKNQQGQQDLENPNPYDLIYHRIDTSNGQSGGPFFNYNHTNGQLQVIGIHAEGFRQNTQEKKKQNVAVLLNNEIQGFLKKYGYNPGSIHNKIKHKFTIFDQIKQKNLTNQRLIQINYCGLLKNLESNHKQQVIQRIFQLENIRFLNLNSNKIKSQISGWVENLKRLILLQLEDNQINEMPEQICKLKNLKYLKLKDNQIEKMPPIWDLDCLREIDLSHNNLKGQVELNKYEVKDEICHLLPINLRKINIGNNPIKILVFIQQIKWKYLQQIRAQNCFIEKIWFGSCLLGPKVYLKGNNKLQNDAEFLEFLSENEQRKVELDEQAMKIINGLEAND